MTEVRNHLKIEISIEEQLSESKILDLESLFPVVRELLEFATILAHKHLKMQGEDQPLPDPKHSNKYFNSPMHILKQILCKVCCTDENDGNSGNQVQESVLDDLLPNSKYSAGTRALLTLAAFALQYGEFWFYFGTWNDFSDAIGALRRIGNFKEHLLVGERHKQLIRLNDMVKETLVFMDHVINVDKLLTSVYDTTDLPCIDETRHLLQKCSKIAIQTFIHWMVQFDALTDDRSVDLQFSLSTSDELRDYLKQLKEKDTKCLQQIEENKKYWHLFSTFKNFSGIKDVIWNFTYSNGDQHMLWDCYSNKTVTIDEVVKETKILLFMSDLKISDDDISHLTRIYEELKQEYKYTIIWIPAVEEWESEKKKTFEDLKKNMRWYTVVPETHLKGIIRYAKEEWQFNSKPLVVDLNVGGSPKYRIQLEEIKTMGMGAFPFKIPDQQNPFTDLFPVVEGSYTFIYGGTDKIWIEEFEKCIDNKVILFANANISIQRYHLENVKEKLDKFWTIMGNSLRICSEGGDPSLPEYNAILKLFSLKKETSWALLLNNKYTVSVSGHGKTMGSALESFEWETELGEKNFVDRFRDHHEVKERVLSLPCVAFESDSFSWALPRTMNCHCGCFMENVTIRRCCHGNQNDK